MLPENVPPFDGTSPAAEPHPAGPQGPASLSGSRFDLITIAQLAISGLGMALSLLAAGFLGLMGLIMLFGESGEPESMNALFAMSAISLFASLIAMPSFIYSLQNPLGRMLLPRLTMARVRGMRISTLLLLIWPLVLLLGNFAMQQVTFSWLLLPPLLLLAAGIPAWWLIEIARRGLPSGSRQRGWGLVNFSIFITTPLLMIVEIMAIAVVVMLIAVWIGAHPEILNSLQQFSQRMANSPLDTEAIMELIAPFMRNPWVIFGIISLTAGVVPLIEELIKPLAVWLLAGRRPSPAEGFVAGVLCGAGFGMIESMLYLSNPTGESWALLAAGRAGTIMLHITTTALVGWAMALAWRDGAYARLGGVYLLAVAIHGLWNGLAVLTGFSVLLESAPENMRLLYELSRIAPFGVSALAVAIFGLLLWSNNFLRTQTGRAVLPVEPVAETRRNLS